MRNIVLISMLFITTYAFAQDVIVKKDGSTILSKVTEIGTSEVKYKKYSNQDGPTYSISISDILSINYENGDKEDFSNANKEIQKESSYLIQEESYSAKRKLQADDLLEQARILEVASIACIVIGAGTIISAFFVKDNTLNSIMIGGGILVCSGGGGTLKGLAIKKRREAQSLLSSAPLFRYDFNYENFTLSPSINLMSENITNTPQLGLGLSITF